MSEYIDNDGFLCPNCKKADIDQMELIDSFFYNVDARRDWKCTVCKATILEHYTLHSITIREE